jgi:hypothetical protein
VRSKARTRWKGHIESSAMRGRILVAFFPGG